MMKWLVLGLLVLAVALAQDSSSEEKSEEVNELPLAETCNPETCILPDCRCSSTQIPGGLAPRDTPQFVLVTFDDGINILNIETYREILYGRRNSNNCPAGTTFYVSHEYTNYQLVNELYNNGFEIALHSITHRVNQTYWAQASTEDMLREFGDQRIQMTHFANIPFEALNGIRIPFLQMTGNASFEAMSISGLKYDASWPTTAFMQPGLWPYSLDYASTQDCIVPPCPTASIPGTWVLPIISFTDLNGLPCSFVDACFTPPDFHNEDAWFLFIVSNFERQYLGNRAPFGFYVHEWFLSTYPAVKNALARFLDLVNNLNDAFMVNSNDVIEWVRDPVPIDEYRSKPCRTVSPAHCPANSCGPLVAEHTSMEYWMQICNVCPARYPWIGNPLGQA